MIVAVRSGEC
ncbi:hypothetical protein AVEN_166003-1, partial [Araneus ventricosus]